MKHQDFYHDLLFQVVCYNKYSTKYAAKSYKSLKVYTLSMETVISCIFFILESRQIQNKLGPSAI